MHTLPALEEGRPSAFPLPALFQPVELVFDNERATLPSEVKDHAPGVEGVVAPGCDTRSSEVVVLGAATPLRFNVRMLLLQGAPFSLCCSGRSESGPQGVGIGRHIPTELRVLVSKSAEHGLHLPGGPYCAALDGGDPVVEDACLVRAGARHVKDQTGLDLTHLHPDAFTKLLTLHWRRADGGTSRAELTVVFVLHNGLARAGVRYVPSPHHTERKGGHARVDKQGGAGGADRRGRRPWVVRTSAVGGATPAPSDGGDEGAPPPGPCLRVLATATHPPVKHRFLSLAGLVDYRVEDKGERTCEASLAGEGVMELLWRSCGALITRAVEEGVAFVRGQPVQGAPQVLSDSGAPALVQGEDDSMGLFDPPSDEEVPESMRRTTAGGGAGRQQDVAQGTDREWLQAHVWDVVLAFRMLDRNGVGFVAACDLESVLMHCTGSWSGGCTKASARAVVANALALCSAPSLLQGTLAELPPFSPRDQVLYLPMLLASGVVLPDGDGAGALSGRALVREAVGEDAAPGFGYSGADGSAMDA